MMMIAVIAALGLVVFFHELGHFLVCRWTGIRVLRFAFGFGPEIVGFTRGDTRYSICAFPLGGFVKPAGEDPEEVTGAPDEFFSKSWKARTAVALAGPAMNYLFAFVIFWGTMVSFGLPEINPNAVLGSVLEGSPAAAAGLKAEDKVLSITAKGEKTATVQSWEQMAGFIHKKPDTVLTLQIERAGRTQSVEVITKKSPQGIGLIGVAPATQYVKVSPLKAASESLDRLYHWSFSSLGYIWQRIVAGEKVDLAGPVGIVTMMGSAAKAGWDSFLGLLAVISVAIGFFNLFPIPLLDGGHVILYLWEGISRRKLTRQFLTRANMVGLMILLPIFIFAMYNDIARLWNSKNSTEFQETIKQQP